MSSDPRIDVTSLSIPKKSLFFKSHLYDYFEHNNDNRNLLSYCSNDLTMAFSKQWNPSQDSLLVDSVSCSESIQWSEIANNLDKSERSCLSRFYNVANPSINKSAWSSDEEKQLFELTKKYGLHSWCEISVELGSDRTPFECLRHYQQTLNNDIINQKNWTDEEDIQLRDAILQHGMNWQLISRKFSDRSAQQCMNRWRKSPYCQEDIITGHWQPHEERKLFLAAIAYEIPSLAASKRPVSDLEGDGNGDANVEEERKVAVDWRAIAKLIPGK